MDASPSEEGVPPPERPTLETELRPPDALAAAATAGHSNRSRPERRADPATLGGRLDASPAIEADNPEPTEPRVRLVDLPVDLSLHLAKIPIEDTLHLDRDRPALVFVLQVVNTLPAVIVPLLDLDAERRPDVLRCQVGEVVGTTEDTRRRQVPAAVGGVRQDQEAFARLVVVALIPCSDPLHVHSRPRSVR